MRTTSLSEAIANAYNEVDGSDLCEDDISIEKVNTCKDGKLSIITRENFCEVEAVYWIASVAEDGCWDIHRDESYYLD